MIKMNEEMNFYNKHYIKTDSNGNIISGWSDGPYNTRTVTEDDILINDKGGYQFRLIVDGELTEENPPLYDNMMIPLYRWDGEKVIKRPQDEIDAEREAIAEKQRKVSRIAELKRMLSGTDYAVIKIAEGAAAPEDYADIICQRQEWRTEINELEGGQE